MNRLVKHKIDEINHILDNNCPTYKLNTKPLEKLSEITGETVLEFHEHFTLCKSPSVIRRRYRHFKLRGLPSETETSLHKIYLCGFRNVYTNYLHPKFGATQFIDVGERFAKNSTIWEYNGQLCAARSGPKKQILGIEKRIHRFVTEQRLVAQDVVDFVWGGKTELLIPIHLIKPDHLQHILSLITDDGIDSLSLNIFA